MNLSSEFVERYQEYLQHNCPDLDSDSLSRLASSLESTSWDEPTSATDLNNFAVVAMIEAEQSQDPALREIYLGMALEALNNGVELYAHPMCTAHLALLLAMTGEMEQARQITFPCFINTLQFVYSETEKIPLCIVYLPPTTSYLKNLQNEQLTQILQAKDGYTQSLLMLSEALCCSQLVLYSEMGLRLLQLASQLFPDSVHINFKLAISQLGNKQWEGLLYLHRARQLAPDSVRILQALYLAYQDLQEIEVANYWRSIAQDIRPHNFNSVDWLWTNLEVNAHLTYIPFETDLILAVEPSFRSIVTSVLMAEGDWFEKEMELWRNWIKPGMTVIDVGANVGVYTFSAAQRVGSTGCVLAVEPFSGCVRCLQETCKINQLNMVKVCEGAASDRNGTAQLTVYTASELNEIVTDDVAQTMPSGSFEDVSCFTLDSLVEQEKLSKVDFLKMDAEGHELAVLAGSNKILSEFFPVILYENIAGSKGSNLPVADYLREKGYQLFRYQPYVQKYIHIASVEDLKQPLNLVAIPFNKISQFNI
ncbi:FkbM family methyltransferase [Microcoleus sp. PH2017_30_WIL_O_A]|uniref:FkbM family methyltransferase n=1 Tax=Microcoleus sp. PH2017_30_WIL_O_A TaxID=2798840 RepID=UPI001DB98C48|nr:FkbM family methyltransferase [Microcoleus sp. PH2017_30_WIL_O_A]MCC3587170.1 FkbM family methyltransferase [Microcoleus sp. PH2017_30_WIL_O_A]